MFPDLLPPYGPQDERPIDYYEILGVPPSKPIGSVSAAFIRKARQFLAKCDGIAFDPEAYMQILDAGFVLRKARLRVSHDLIVCRTWLIDKKRIAANGSFESPEQPEPDQAKEKLDVENENATPAKPPLLIEMLVSAGIIGAAEVAALTAQKVAHRRCQLSA